MQQQYPFLPRAGGNTLNVAVLTTAANVPALSIQAEGGSVRLANVGTQTVFVNFSGAATVAAGMPILANTIEVFTIAPNTTISTIAAATGSTLYATVGDGM